MAQTKAFEAITLYNAANFNNSGGDYMWKLLGWPLAFAAAVGAYWLHAEGQKRERVLQAQLQIQQQLVAQVSNRLTVVEAQFSLYKAKQEREALERETRDRERERDFQPERTGVRPVANERQPPPYTAPEPAEEMPQETPEDQRTRRGNNPVKNIGDGINTIIDRLRGGLNN